MKEIDRRNPLMLLPRLLWTVVQTHPWAAVGLGLLTLLSSLLPAVDLWITQRALDELVDAMGQGRAGFFAMLPWMAGFTASQFARIALDMAAAVLRTDVQERVGIHLQAQVIDKVQRVELSYFEDPDFYDTLKRANEDMSGRLLNLLQVVLQVLGAVGSLGAILAMLLTGHWALAPIVVIGSVPGLWVMMRMNKKLHWVYRIRTPQYRHTSYLRELMTERDPAKEIRLFTLMDHLLDDWRQRTVELAAERRQLEIKQAWLGGLNAGIGTTAYSLCLGLIAWLVAGAALTIGQYGMLTRAVQQFTWRLEQIMRSASSLHEESLYLGDLYEFLQLVAPEEESGPEQGPAIIPAHLSLRFEGVSFRYPGSDQDVLSDLSLEIRPGERLALVGQNGAGKTTLVKLMMGLYRPTQGRILLGDRPLHQWPRSQLRQLFAAVFQDFVRYQFSVRDNIAFGHWDQVQEGQVERAGRLAGADTFIDALPAGYDTPLGKPLGGEDLSMGQWQKLSMARALVRPAQFIILDEPTAALDPKAEAEVYRRFAEMTIGKASVLISHRLGSARIADRILVLGQGRLLEEGSHNELMRQGGEYSRLFNLQAQWYD
ncbi:MAG: ATP-binding cassette domain-containing protein [Candidatus Latescibacteria bacterium]|nr:ATP-binding cassette domain-containing protein [Candidatus Latescibacterota bacterium]